MPGSGPARPPTGPPPHPIGPRRPQPTTLRIHRAPSPRHRTTRCRPGRYLLVQSPLVPCPLSRCAGCRSHLLRHDTSGNRRRGHRSVRRHPWRIPTPRRPDHPGRLHRTQSIRRPPTRRPPLRRPPLRRPWDRRPPAIRRLRAPTLRPNPATPPHNPATQPRNPATPRHIAGITRHRRRRRHRHGPVPRRAKAQARHPPCPATHRLPRPGRRPDPFRGRGRSRHRGAHHFLVAPRRGAQCHRVAPRRGAQCHRVAPRRGAQCHRVAPRPGPVPRRRARPRRGRPRRRCGRSPRAHVRAHWHRRTHRPVGGRRAQPRPDHANHRVVPVEVRTVRRRARRELRPAGHPRPRFARGPFDSRRRCRA